MGTGKAVIRKLRGKKPPAPQIRLSPSQEKRLVKKLGQQVQSQPLAGTIVPAPGSSAAARSGAFRFRRHLVVFEWIALLLGAGLFLHWRDAAATAAALGFIAAVAIAVLCRHLGDFARATALFIAALTVLWLPLIALLGRPAAAVALLCWVPVAVRHIKHYRWRDEPSPEPDLSDVQLWASTLGHKGRLAGSQLIPYRSLPGGGSQYRLMLMRGEQDSSDVFGAQKRIASLFGKPVTEAYPERFPDSREHEVILTRLRTNSLEKVRIWDGETVDPQTGLAVFADFPDGEPVHFRFWSPRNGAEQSIVVGVKGAGKSYLFHLLLSLAVTSPVPIIPIVLDPQQGQSLPDWRGRVPYARGIRECARYLKAIEAGMTARSDYLADFEWTDEDGYARPGMDFYDPNMSGLPLIFPVFDEAHLCLSDPAVGAECTRITGNLVKLNRKAGGHLVLASHAMLLSQLGDMTLRAMVIGGNVIALRTGENVSGTVVGLEADPKLLPRVFADGSETQGLGYSVGPDRRPDSPMRCRLVKNPRKVAMEHKVPEFDEVFGKAFRASLAATAPKPERPVATLAAVPPPAADDDGPEGRTCSDAILAVLDGEMTRGQIIASVKTLTEGDWGRPKTFSTRAVQNALTAMTEDGRILRPRDGTYRRALQAVK